MVAGMMRLEVNDLLAAHLEPSKEWTREISELTRRTAQIRFLERLMAKLEVMSATSEEAAGLIELGYGKVPAVDSLRETARDLTSQVSSLLKVAASLNGLFGEELPK